MITQEFKLLRIYRKYSTIFSGFESFIFRRNNLDLEGVVTDIDGDYERGYRQEAAIRMAQQKKVTFHQEQLAFNINVDNTGVFAGE